MKTITVDTNEPIVQELEATNFEINARRSIITYMLSNNMDVNTPAFRQYQREYANFCKEYEDLKSELFVNYILPQLDQKPNGWSLDFTTGVITLS